MNLNSRPNRAALGLAFALGCAAAAPAHAQTANAGGDRAAKAQALLGQLDARFNAADADHDGKLTRDEAVKMPRVHENFDAIDAEKTGSVTVAQIKAYVLQQAGKRKPA